MLNKAYSLNDLVPGMQTNREFVFSEQAVKSFSELIDDEAPVHFDEDFAVQRGYAGRIVHGFLVGSVFSGMLGQELPGSNTVINALSLKYHHPVYIGERVTYKVAVKHISPAVGAVVLTLSVVKDNGETAVSGQTTCSFQK